MSPSQWRCPKYVSKTQSCCGITLPEQEPEVCDKEHQIILEIIDDEYHVRMDHSMNKGHYISFIAYVTSGSVEIVKLYPEQDISVRFRKKGTGILYAYCNRHGMYRMLVKPNRAKDGYSDARDERLYLQTDKYGDLQSFFMKKI